MDQELKTELLVQLAASEEELSFSSRRMVNQTVTEKKVLKRIQWVREQVQNIN